MYIITFKYEIKKNKTFDVGRNKPEILKFSRIARDKNSINRMIKEHKRDIEDEIKEAYPDYTSTLVGDISIDDTDTWSVKEAFENMNGKVFVEYLRESGFFE